MSRTLYNKFNRGEVDEKVMARDDVERIVNSGSLVENFTPLRAGPMQYRPGFEFSEAAKPNESYYLIPFVDDGENPTFLELSQSAANPSVETVRFIVNDAVATATATDDTLANGSFTDNIGSWTADHDGAGAAAWDAGGRAKLTGATANGAWGRLYQTVTQSAGERSIRVVVDSTPILVQIGTDGSQSSDIFQDVLGLGIHVLTFTPTDDYTITLSNDKPYAGYVSFCDHLAAGAIELSGSIVLDTTTTAGTLQSIRYTQVNDVCFITDGAYITERRSYPFWLIKRRGLKSWSFELPEQLDGPFGPINITGVTLAVTATTGDTTLTASSDFFNDTATDYRDQYQIAHGETAGVCEITSVTNKTTALVRVLRAFGATTATADWNKGELGITTPGPTASEIFDGRLWLAGGARLWGSVSDRYTSFDTSLDGNSAAVSKTLGFGPVQNVSWLRGGDILLMGLSSEEVEVNSNADQDALNANNARVRRATNKGSARVRPEVVDKVVYFVQRGLKKIFALSGLQGEQVSAQDTTILHPNITSPGVQRMVYSSEPEPRMYILLTDGSLRVLLFDEAEDVIAWSRITVAGGGVIKDIAASPTTDEDAVMIIVERGGVAYIERLAKYSESLGGLSSRHYDSHVAFDAPGGTLTGLAHLDGVLCHVWADGVERQTVTPSSGSATLAQSGYAKVVIGIRHTAKWKSNKLSRYVDKSVLNYRKRVVQMGLVMRSVALRTLKYGADEQHLSSMPETDQGRARAPTDEPIPSIVGTIVGATDGAISVQEMRLFAGTDKTYLVAACDTLVSAPSAQRMQFLAYLDGYMYNVGGTDVSNGNLKELWRYEVASGAYDQMAPAPNIAVEHSVCAGEGKFMVMSASGGFQVYNVSTDAWLASPAQPTAARKEAALAYYDGKVYYYGGNNGGASSNTWGIYDVGADSWDETAYSGSPETKRSHCAAAPQSGVGAGKIYFFGGLTGATTDTRKMEIYDIGSNTFGTAIDATIPTKAYGKLEATDDGELYQWGGGPRVGAGDALVWKFNITAGTWSVVNDGTGVRPLISSYQFGLAFDPINGDLYKNGGLSIEYMSSINPDGNPNGWTNDLWKYSISTNLWTELKKEGELAPISGAIRIADVTDPAAMVSLSALNISSGTDDCLGYGVVTDQGYAYLRTREHDDSTLNRGLAVVNILDPSNPTQEAYLAGSVLSDAGKCIAKQGGFLFLVSLVTDGVLEVVKVDPPSAPVLEAVTLDLVTVSSNANPDSIAINQYYLYVPWEGNLHIVDISDPRNISLSSRFSLPVAAASQCQVERSTLYVLDVVAGTVLAYDVADPVAPVLIGFITDTALVGATDFIATSPWLYVSTATTVVVLDFRDPSVPLKFAAYAGFTDLNTLTMATPNVLFGGSSTGKGTVYAADQRSWAYVDYDEMSFAFDGTYDTDSRVLLQATGPATITALTLEIEDVDHATNGSERSN